MFAAEWGTGQVLWSMMWFFLFTLWIMLVLSVLSDILRAKSLSGFSKALWTLAIILLPYLGVFMYLIVNGNSMNERASHQNNEAPQDSIGHEATSSSADQLATLTELHDVGKLSDSEFAAAAAKVAAD